MKSKRSAPAVQPKSSGGEEVPALPVWKAFVVQFSRETNRETGTFSGRVEHMSSGRRARFGSSQELVAVLGTMLDQLGERTS